MAMHVRCVRTPLSSHKLRVSHVIPDSITLAASGNQRVEKLHFVGKKLKWYVIILLNIFFEDDCSTCYSAPYNNLQDKYTLTISIFFCHVIDTCGGHGGGGGEVRLFTLHIGLKKERMSAGGADHIPSFTFFQDIILDGIPYFFTT